MQIAVSPTKKRTYRFLLSNNNSGRRSGLVDEQIRVLKFISGSEFKCIIDGCDSCSYC